MVQSCCIKHCKERQKRGTKISFHKFPKNEELKQEWIKAIKRDNFVVTPYSRVCSKHFESDCFVESLWSSKRLLKTDAIPNMSNVSERQDIPETDIVNVSLIKIENETISLKSESMDDNLIHIASAEGENMSLMKPLRKKRKIYAGDFKESDVISKKHNYMQIMNATIARKNKQIKFLQQKNRRLLQKIKDVHSLVDDLRKKSLITEAAFTILKIRELGPSSNSERKYLQIEP